MVNLSGTPGVITTVTDLSIITANQEKGIICVLAATKRGLPGKFYKTSNWTQFRRKLGGIIKGNDDALLCKLALEAGAVFYVGRLFHLTDIDDVGTITGTKASQSITQSINEALASGSIDITGGSAGAGNEVATVTVNAVDILGGAVAWGTSNDATATAVAAAITANTSVPNYTAVAVGNKVNITAVAGSGATPNGFVVAGTVGGDVTVGNAVPMSGGVSAGSANVAFEAEAVGDGYNGTIITVRASTNNKVGYVDIVVALNDSDVEASIIGIDASAIDQTAIDNINAKLRGVDAGVQVTSITNYIAIGEATLAGGVQDLTELADADYIGSQISKTGFHTFDDVQDSMRIANLNKAVPEVDLALASYCDGRKDMRGVVRTALGLGVSGVGDYRNGTGVYAHSPIDTMYCDLWYSDAEITDPEDTDIKDKAVTALAYKLASRSVKDREAGEWYSDSGQQSGIGSFSKLNKVAINFLSPAYKSDYDTLYEQGVNAIVEHDAFKIVPWGNRSCLLDRTSLLSKMNIADMVVFISRALKTLAGGQSFKPNDVQMFNELYRIVRPFIVGLVDGRAIEGDNSAGRGEGKWWHWFGDQEAQSLDDLSFNTREDVDAGKYRCRFAFKPIAANEYIAIDIAPADSNTILNVQVLQTV